VRLSLSMVTVTLTILTIVVVFESLAFWREYQRLPPVLRQPFFGSTEQIAERPLLDTLPEQVKQAYVARVERFQEAFQDFRRARRRSVFLSGLLALLLGVTLAITLARRISKPLAEVSRAARAMQGGNLSARVNLERLQHADAETIELSQSFNAMAEALEENELERKNMIADIAHELRTPLAVMQARLVAMQDEVVPLTKTELEKVYKQTELLSRLVADLRTLSLAEAGRLSLQKREVDITVLLQNIVSSFETSANLKHIRLEFSAIPAVTLYADADRLSQVFSNLLDNALRYTPERGRTEVMLTSVAEKVTVSVRDGGPGLASESLNKVFDRFYKADERSGSGLGLSIVQTLVKLHGGLVTARNHPEGGAVFEVTLTRASPSLDH
jgi:two-component system, OmpR family, sensor histidine kinase BaeS